MDVCSRSGEDLQQRHLYPGFDPGPTYGEEKRKCCCNGCKPLKPARTYTQTPEPSMFTECFKQRSQLCSNRNFPIWLPAFYKKSYTIAGLTVLRSRLGHLITKAEFTRRVIWTQSNMKAEFIKLFMPTICHSEKKHRLICPAGKLS